MLETGYKSKMKASSYKADGILAKELEEELMKFTMKYDYKVDANVVEKTDNVQMKDANLVEKTDEVQTEDGNLVEKTDKVQTNGDVEVNVTECTKSLGYQLFATEYQDTTEGSSSFDDTNSGFESVDTLGDSEASSGFRGDDAPALNFDGFGESFMMRKRKLTAHWRSFIQPLRWRCKWVELQIKKLQLQAQQYDRELVAYNKQKQIELDNSTTIDGLKSLPFSQKNAKNDVFKRKKRRRAEETMDIAAYMSHHNLFSCYENRKCFSEVALLNNESKNPATQKIKIGHEIWGNDELLSFEPGDGDNSLERMLRKIDFLQSQVVKLNGKVNSIMRENAERITFADSLNYPDNENGTESTYIAPQSTSVLVPHTAVTSQGDFPVPNGSISHACIGAYKSVDDGVLIDNQREMNSFEEVKIHPIQMPLVPKDGLGSTTTPPVMAEPDLPADGQPPAKIRSIAKLTAPKTRRKRGRRKGTAGRRGRRSTG